MIDKGVFDYFKKLYREKRELALLEWTYLLMAIISIVIAGLLALFDRSLGISILIVPLVAFIAMSMNVVAWALIKLGAESFLGEESQKTVNSSAPKRKTVVKKKK